MYIYVQKACLHSTCAQFCQGGLLTHDIDTLAMVNTGDTRHLRGTCMRAHFAAGGHPKAGLLHSDCSLRAAERDHAAARAVHQRCALHGDSIGHAHTAAQPVAPHPTLLQACFYHGHGITSFASCLIGSCAPLLWNEQDLLPDGLLSAACMRCAAWFQ